MMASLSASGGAARRGLCLDVLETNEPSTNPSWCVQAVESDSSSVFDDHRTSLNSALSQADTPTFGRSPVGLSPLPFTFDHEDGLLSQEETRDAFVSNRDSMFVDGEHSATSIYIPEPERKKRTTRRHGSLQLDATVLSPHPKSEDDAVDGDERMRESSERSPLGVRSRSWAGPACGDSMEVEDRKKLRTSNSCGSVGEIEVDTVAEILQQESHLRQLYDHVYVIDCRYQYEFEGGHISFAGDWVSVHHFAPHQVEEAKEFLFGAHSRLELGNDRICVIFHCEFSQKRGPAMCEKMRSHDRSINIQVYPALYYPEMYVMKGGYKSFFGAGFGHLCEPNSYVREQDERFTEQCKLFHKLARTKSSGRGGRQLLCPAPSHISPLR